MVVVEFRSGGSLIVLDLFVMREGVGPAQSHLALGDDVNEGDQEEGRGAGQDCSGDIQSDQVGSVPDPVDLRVALEAGQIDSQCSEGPAEPPQEEAEKCTIGMKKTGEDLVHADGKHNEMKKRGKGDRGLPAGRDPEARIGNGWGVVGGAYQPYEESWNEEEHEQQSDPPSLGGRPSRRGRCRRWSPRTRSGCQAQPGIRNDRRS
jgi:hypothetical protein